jgi:hypothetical protein
MDDYPGLPDVVEAGRSIEIRGQFDPHAPGAAGGAGQTGNRPGVDVGALSRDPRVADHRGTLDRRECARLLDRIGEVSHFVDESEGLRLGPGEDPPVGEREDLLTTEARATLDHDLDETRLHVVDELLEDNAFLGHHGSEGGVQVLEGRGFHRGHRHS